MYSISDRKVILEIRGVSKNFGSVVALNNVSFEVYENEIVGLVGDNGAGKSTLIKIISGNFPSDSGEIYLEGKRVNFKSPEEARCEGIETVYQDLSLCENLDSISNLFVGREIFKDFFGFKILQKKEMEKKTIEVLNEIGIEIPSVKENVAYLSGGQRQAVSLGRFVAWSKKLVLLDEPTAALGVRETRKALDLIKRIKNERKISVILISHNLQQIFEIVDRIIVLRHGEVVGIREKEKTSPDEIVSLITGAIFIRDEKR
jgi:D-xylose transport system ATP-binding protein